MTFQKGQIANPNGRPKKGFALSELLRSKMDKDKIVAKLLEKAYEGEDSALKEVFDRVEGKATQRHELEHEYKQSEFAEEIKKTREAFTTTTEDVKQ